jgi:hypothetical protein
VRETRGPDVRIRLIFLISVRMVLVVGNLPVGDDVRAESVRPFVLRATATVFGQPNAQT